MPKIRLQHSIRTLDHRELFPSGALLSKETSGTSINLHRTHSYPTCPLVLHGSVKEDFLKFLSVPPFVTIFSDKRRSDFLTLLEAARFPIPVLQSLDYFKQRDFHTYAHVLMVFALSTVPAMDLIPDYQECIRLFATGPTHDIGKICVPLPILKKASPLTRANQLPTLTSIAMGEGRMKDLGRPK